MLLLQTLQVFNPDTRESKPYELSEYEISRYAEWRFAIHSKVIGTLTPEELDNAPKIGLDKSNGFYSLGFSGGCLYVEVENKVISTISGYGSAEIQIFDRITKEHGEQIQRAYDAQRVSIQQNSEIQRRDNQIPESNEPISGMVVQ